MKQVSIILVITVLFCSVLASSALALCVRVSKANVRTGPGTNYNVAWQVYMYMPFAKTGLSNDKEWYAVKDVDGDIFWIHKNLVTESYKCAVVKSNKVNVRRGPGTGYGTVKDSPAQKYFSYRVLSTQGNWVRLRDEWGGIGWVRRDFLWIQ